VSAEAPVERVDALGLLCPLPVLRTAAAIRRAPPGAVVELVGDDPGLLEDLPAWCEGSGHELLGIERGDGGVLIARVRNASE
jgi:TusA-related sulfurtransferase